MNWMVLLSWMHFLRPHSVKEKKIKTKRSTVCGKQSKVLVITKVIQNKVAKKYKSHKHTSI